jgi:hypothetical protein
VKKKSQFTRKEIDSETLYIESMFGLQSKQGKVCLSWGDNAGAITPAEARAHAARVIEAAAAAENDEIFVMFMVEKVGTSIEDAVRALQDLRAIRERMEADA